MSFQRQPVYSITNPTKPESYYEHLMSNNKPISGNDNQRATHGVSFSTQTVAETNAVFSRLRRRMANDAEVRALQSELKQQLSISRGY